MSTELEAAIERMKADYQAGLSSPGTLYGEFHLSDVQRVLAAVDAAANATDPDVRRRFVGMLDLMDKHRLALDAARQSVPVTAEEVADWLGDRPESFNRRDYTDEETTFITIAVDDLARDFSDAFAITRKPTETEEP